MKEGTKLEAPWWLVVILIAAALWAVDKLQEVSAGGLTSASPTSSFHGSYKPFYKFNPAPAQGSVGAFSVPELLAEHKELRYFDGLSWKKFEHGCGFPMTARISQLGSDRESAAIFCGARTFTLFFEKGQLVGVKEPEDLVRKTAVLQ